MQWSWYLDVDECCLEIHAPPLTFAEYQDEGIKEIIESHIYDAAKVKNIKAGEDGKGGGHLSVDMASGFDNEPRLVLKTLLLWEVLQYCIDEYKNTIDTKDNKNAGYIFDCSRKCFINQLENQFTCKVNIGSTAKLRIDHTDIIKWLLEYTRINVMSYKKRTDAFKKIKLTSLLINTLNDMYIGKNAKSVNDQIDIYIKNITDLQKLLRDNPIHEQCESKGKIAAEFSNHILHYQNINLEHALEPPPADQNKLPTSRIEFRRFVSQASYADLKDDIESLLNMIAFSRAVVDKRLSKLVCNMQHFIIRRKWS
ncbi:MAG: hypothetical protein FIA91_02890 [Geobacter sp.]|nr:hypothetical protein [Geobacter sp.]